MFGIYASRPLHQHPLWPWGVCQPDELYICHGAVRSQVISFVLHFTRSPAHEEMYSIGDFTISRYRYRATKSAANSDIQAPALPSRCRTRGMSFEMMNNERRSPASRNDVHRCTVSCNWSRSYLPTLAILEHPWASQVADEPYPCLVDFTVVSRLVGFSAFKNILWQSMIRFIVLFLIVHIIGWNIPPPLIDVP